MNTEKTVRELRSQMQQILKGNQKALQEKEVYTDLQVTCLKSYDKLTKIVSLVRWVRTAKERSMIEVEIDAIHKQIRDQLEVRNEVLKVARAKATTKYRMERKQERQERLFWD